MKKVVSILFALSLTLILAAAVVIPEAQAAEAGTSGEWSYERVTLSGEDGLAVTGYTGGGADIFIPATLEVEENGQTVSYPVLKVGDGAFQGNTDLNSVTLSRNIRAIGGSAFAGTTNLVCIVTGDALTEIGANAFSGCTAFNSVVLGDSVTAIGAGAFAGCDALTIYCNDSSYAKSYAVDNNIAYVLMSSDAEPETYEVDSMTFYVVNGEAMLLSGTEATGNVIVPSYVEGYPVTSVNQGAFQRNADITSITFGGTVTEIGDYAFAYSSIETVELPASLSKIGKGAFTWCGSLTGVTIPEGITEIPEAFFQTCSALEQVSLPDGITKIGSCAFNTCQRLKTIALPKELREIGDNAFSQSGFTSISIPAKVTSIGAYSFQYCYALTTVDLPEGLTVIEESTFGDCVSLQSILIPFSVQRIHGHAFDSCRQLILSVHENSYAHTFSIANGLAYYVIEGESAAPTLVERDGLTYYKMDGHVRLMYCDQTKEGEVVIPDTVDGLPVTELNTAAFRDCVELTKVSIPDGITTLPSSLFNRCEKLVSVVLPDSVMRIEQEAFMLCHSLAEVDIPDIVTYIGDCAFFGCGSVEEFVLPSELTTVRDQTFAYCYKLKSVSIPEGVTHIGYGAFMDCYMLRTCTVPDSVTFINNSAFSYCSSLVLCVQEGSYGQEYAVNANFPYFVISESEPLPVFAEEGQVVYYIHDGVAVARTYTTENESPANLSISDSVNGFPVTEIAPYAFRGVDTLTSVSIPDTVTKIGSHAFELCVNLTELELPDSVFELGPFAFGSCGLTHVKLPSHLTTLTTAFFGCDQLCSIEIPPSVTVIEDQALAYCTALEHLAIPDSVTKIGWRVFGECRNLISVNIPSGVTSLREYLFENCRSLSEITISPNIEKIWGGAFSGCSSLKRVVIPKDTQLYDSTAFSDCPNLIVCVYENSPAHQTLKDGDVAYFVLPKTDNPEFSSGTEITGTVTSVTGTPLANVTVELLDRFDNLRESVTTDETGAYAFTYAEVGTYTIRARDAQGNSGSEDIAIRRKTAFDVALLGNTHLTIKDSVAISGVVTDQTDAPLAGVSVSLLTESGMTLRSAVTDQTGSYTLENIPNGTYTLLAQTGGVAQTGEVTVLAKNGDVTFNITMTIGASITGLVTDSAGEPAVWAEVTVTNSNSDIVAVTNTDASGAYRVDSLPVDVYGVTATMETLSGRLTGAAAVEITGTETVTAETIVLRTQAETETQGTATISGKVTAHGQGQTSTVVLRDVFFNQIASCATTANGKYNFYNVRDGIYTVIATTEDQGAGFTVVIVLGGRVSLFSRTNITVYKTGTVEAVEARVGLLPEVDADPAVIQNAKADIIAAKALYDALPPLSQKSVSAAAVEKLNGLIAKLTADAVTVNGQGVSIRGLETIWGEDDLSGESGAAVAVTVTTGHENLDADKTYELEQAAAQAENEGMTVVETYTVDVVKTTGNTEKKIRNVTKDTEGTGSVTLTFDIPPEAQGHENYSLVHNHNGQLYTLADLDDDPATITVETDRFSEFLLAYDDEARSASSLDVNEVDFDPATMTASIRSHTAMTVNVIFAAYRDGRMVSVKIVPAQTISVGDNPVAAQGLDVSQADEVRVMVLDSLEHMTPLFEKATVSLN